jgi:ABC-2 type transport system permease protein
VSTFVGFAAVLRKELVWALRTKRALITGALFIILGVMNAPIAWGTPYLLDYMGASSGMDVASLGIAIPEADALQAWAQFFKNVGQMGILAILLICGSTLSAERSKGTLVLPLTKGLGRSGVVFAKLIVMSLLWAGAMMLAAASSLAVTAVIFPGDSVEQLPLALFALWLFGELLLCLIPLSSLLMRGSFAGLILPGAFILVTLVLSTFPDFFFYNPMLLTSDGIAAMAHAAAASSGAAAGSAPDLTAPMACSIVLGVAAVAAAVPMFRKVEM